MPPAIGTVGPGSFVAARLRELAEARAHTGTRLWHARLEEARGPRLKAAEWIVAENLRGSSSRGRPASEGGGPYPCYSPAGEYPTRMPSSSRGRPAPEAGIQERSYSGVHQLVSTSFPL